MTELARLRSEPDWGQGGRQLSCRAGGNRAKGIRRRAKRSSPLPRKGLAASRPGATSAAASGRGLAGQLHRHRPRHRSQATHLFGLIRRIAAPSSQRVRYDAWKQVVRHNAVNGTLEGREMTWRQEAASIIANATRRLPYDTPLTARKRLVDAARRHGWISRSGSDTAVTSERRTREASVSRRLRLLVPVRHPGDLQHLQAAAMIELAVRLMPSKPRL